MADVQAMASTNSDLFVKHDMAVLLCGTYAVDLLDILLGWCSGLCLIWTHQSVSCW